MKILITGAGGFLGRGLVIPFEEHNHTLRLMDVVPFTSRHEVVVGSVENYAQVEAAMRGMDALVIGHMAPRGEKNINYQTPKMPFDINVTGTANLFHAAKACGVKRIVLISSTSVANISTKPSEQPLRGTEYYSLSKVLQEVIAEQFARVEKMQIACLRVGYILDGEANVDKYGKKIGEINYADTDRRDIGEVARLCLECPDLGFEMFNVMSTQESLERAAVKYTCERLKWKPRYDFSWLAPEGSTKKKATT